LILAWALQQCSATALPVIMSQTCRARRALSQGITNQNCKSFEIRIFVLWSLDISTAAWQVIA